MRSWRHVSLGLLASALGCSTDGAVLDESSSTGGATSSDSTAIGTSAAASESSGADETSSGGDTEDSGDADEGFCDERVPAFASGDQLVTHPFTGICLVHRTTTSPRPLSYHLVIIDPKAPGVSFVVTPDNGPAPRDTDLQTTRAFLEQEGAQLAINANFFAPWPSVDDYANVRGLAVSDGQPYAPFLANYPFGLNISPDRSVSVVHHARGDETGFATVQGVELHQAVGAREQILTRGVNTADWPDNHPRTGAGVTEVGELVLIVVDGRQNGISEGVTTTELADILLEFGVVDAINLDGGGSSTLAIADPVSRLGNVPSGLSVERRVGNNFAIFATPRFAATPTEELIAYEPFDYSRRAWGGSAWPEGGGVVNLLGGSGWASAWRDDYNHSRASGIAVFPGDAGTGDDARKSKLAYEDDTGAVLLTAGNQMRTSFGTSSSAWRVLDLSKVDPQLLTPGGQLGATGSTLWLSVLAQSHSGTGGDRWAYVELGKALRIGRFAETQGSWGLIGATARSSTITSAKAVLLLVRLEFTDDGDVASLWVDPPLGAPPTIVPNAVVTVPELEFSRVVIEGRYSTDFDELRLGTSWSAVLPTAGSR